MIDERMASSSDRIERLNRNGNGARYLGLAAILLGILLPIFLVVDARRTNGANGFPLDDPWIHLTYARNLHDDGTFSFSSGAGETQGSTSPLYTLLLALGFSVTRDEKVLSYVLGLTFHLAFLAALWSWARRALDRAAWAAAAVAIVALDARVGILAVSGMETSLFLLVTTLAFRALQEDRPVLVALFLGLSIWTRPDGLILLAAFGLAWILRWWTGRGAPRPSPPDRAAILKASSILGLLLGGYALFNLSIGGSPLPNTFGAKTAFYGASPRLHFLREDLREVFTAGAWVVLGLSAAGFAIWKLVELTKRRAAPRWWAVAGWAVGLPLAYLLFLPHGHRFGRYLIPALPAVAILGLAGLQAAVTAVLEASRRRNEPNPGAPPVSEGRGLRDLLLACLLLLQLPAAIGAPRLYREACRYYAVRHEFVGRWLASNTPPGSVVATHDVGAIGFYSGRRIVDIVGVVRSNVAHRIHEPGYVAFLESLFDAEGVTHLAVLREWQEVVNVEPLIVADPEPEVLEVLPWVRGKTHLVPPEATLLNRLAAKALDRRDPGGALGLLRRSLAVDGENPRTWATLGLALEIGGDPRAAERAYRTALELRPGWREVSARVSALSSAERK